MRIKIRKTIPDASLPSRGSDAAAGYDLYAYTDGRDREIPPHSTRLVATGLQVEIPDGYFGAIFARSGLATKRSMRPANCVGVIDSDYRGEVMVALHNDSNAYQKITHGERVAQLVIMPYLSVEFEEVDELSATGRGSGGFGSTGTN